MPFLILVSAIQLKAQTKIDTANDFVEACQSVINYETTHKDEITDTINVGMCSGYLDAFFQFSPIIRDHYKIEDCSPDKVTYGQIIKIFIKYVNEHPEQLHMRAWVILVAALRNAFPCSSK